jgi:hypothetical protein
VSYQLRGGTARGDTPIFATRQSTNKCLPDRDCREAAARRATRAENFVKVICWIQISAYTRRKEYRFK